MRITAFLLSISFLFYLIFGIKNNSIPKVKEIFIVTYIFLANFCFGQCVDSINIELGGYNNNITATKSRNFAYLPNVSTNFCCDIKEIEPYYKNIFDSAKKHIIAKTNSDFYQNLVFQSIDVNYFDAEKIKDFDKNYTNLEQCGKISYYVSYEFNYLDSISYYFGIELDNIGYLLKEPLIPNFNKNKNPFPKINLCEHLQLVEKIRKYKNFKIKTAEYYYNKKASSFAWVLKGDDKKEAIQGKFQTISLFFSPSKNKIIKHEIKKQFWIVHLF